MSFINEKTKEINCKVIFYGPPLCGKSTTLRQIYNKIKNDIKSASVALSQDKDKTLYFDFIPLTLGKIRNYNIRLHLYTVPSEHAYESTRKLISKGVDGIVFIADSQLEKMEANLKSMSNLKEILDEEKEENNIPIVIQYNKRDLPTALPVEKLSSVLNPSHVEEFESIASKRQGVYDALQAIIKKVLVNLKGTTDR